jgi:hypothetical protein
VARKILIVILAFVLCASPAWARWHLDRRDFNSDFRLDTLDLKLRGVGVKTLFMMRLFVASFYLMPQTAVGDELSDVPKHLEVKFYTYIPAATFTSFTISRMKDNVSRDEFSGLQNRFGRMGELFPNIVNGDVFALTYEPGKGTAFVHNGTLRGTIEGADFAKAIFATWIGPRPIDHILKNQVLGLDRAGI